MSDKIDFSKGKLLPIILKFSIPAAISLLITAIYNIINRIFVGNFVGNTALAALSICFPLSFMMIAFGLTCSAGGSTLFSLFRGNKEEDKMNLSFGNAFIMVIVFEAILTAILLIFPDIFLKVFGVTDTTYNMAKTYYTIVSLGCVFQGLTFVFCDFVRASGKPIMGMCVTAIGAITNIVLDAIFVAVLNWGIEGAAIATVIGQVVSVLFGAYLLFGGKTLVKIKKDIFKLDFKLQKEIFRCGFAFWIAQMAMGFISLIYNGQLGKYGGDIAISVYAVISSIMTFVIMPASGISQGIQPILAYNYSSKNTLRVKETLNKASMLSVGVTSIIWVVVMFFPASIIRAFGGGEELMSIGITALRWNFIITPILGYVMLCTTFFQSIGRPNPSIVISLLRQVVALVPFLYLLPKVIGINGIFMAQPISDIIALVICVVLIKREFSNIANDKYNVA